MKQMSFVRNKNKTLFFLIVCIMLISTLGVFAVGMTSHNEHSTCPISMLNNNCSYMDNALAMAIHHISGIQTLTEATLASGVSIILMILSALIISWFIKPVNLILNFTGKSQYIYTRRTTHPIFKRILKWIALRNKLDIYSYAKASACSIS